MTHNVLFVCGKNRLRSPTAEQVFADWPARVRTIDGTALTWWGPRTASALADLVRLATHLKRRRG